MRLHNKQTYIYSGFLIWVFPTFAMWGRAIRSIFWWPFGLLQFGCVGRKYRKELTRGLGIGHQKDITAIPNTVYPG